MGLLKSIRHGLSALRDKSARNQQIDDELESFLNESVAEKMRRGMDSEAALRVARAEIGSRASVRQKVWHAGWESTAETLSRDLIYTSRRLRRSPGLVFVVVLSIGLGIAANATVFSMVSKFLLSGIPVGDPATLITLYRTYDHGQCCNELPFPVYRDLREQAKSFSGVAAYEDILPASLSGPIEPERIWGQAASENYFDVAQIRMAAGRGFAANEYRAPVIVLGYGLWRQRFGGDPGIVGKPINVSGHPYTVVGIAPRGFHGLDQLLDPQFWVPLGKMSEISVLSISEEARNNQWIRVAARLKPGVTQTQAARELDVIAQRLAQAHPDTDKDDGLHIEPINSVSPRFKKPLYLFLTGLSGVAFLVLLIACANVANLLFARGAERQREMAVRIALGATRMRLLRQLLVESLILSVGGGILGVLLSLWATYALSSFRLPAPVPMDLAVHVDAHVLLYSFLLSLLAGLFCGFAPSWAASRPLMPNALKGEETLARPGHRFTLRSMLVVVQITLSVILLSGTGLFLRSLSSAANINTGFRSSGLIMLSIDPQLHRYTNDRSVQLLRAARQRIATLPGVLSATTTDDLPLSMGGRSDGLEVPGRPKPQGSDTVDLYMAGPNYLSTLGIPLLAGRDFSQENSTAPKVAVVNQEFVRRFFQGEDPIGHTVKGPHTSYQIVGVVTNTRSRTLGEDQRPVLYRSVDQNLGDDPSFGGYTFIARYEGDPATLIAAMQHEIHSLDPSLAVFNIQTMEDHMRDALILPRLVGMLFTVFGTSGLLLALIGLSSVMSYTVSRRTKEIGVRMAMGARASQVQSLFVRGGMRLALISVALGVPLAFAAARLTTNLLYGIRPWDPLTFVLAPMLLVIVALIACWLPSRRASHVDPIAALRMD